MNESKYLFKIKNKNGETVFSVDYDGEVKCSGIVIKGTKGVIGDGKIEIIDTGESSHPVIGGKENEFIGGAIEDRFSEGFVEELFSALKKASKSWNSASIGVNSKGEQDALKLQLIQTKERVSQLEGKVLDLERKIGKLYELIQRGIKE